MYSKISLSQDIARNSYENTKNKYKILIGCHIFGDVCQRLLWSRVRVYETAIEQ